MYIVFKQSDIDAYCSAESKKALEAASEEIINGRIRDGKDLNFYLVVNTDESYSDEVADIIEKNIGERISFD